MNEDILDKLIENYSDRLIKYCYSILGNYYDAEEATQDAFVRLYYKLPSLNNDEAVVAYMYRIAYSISVDVLRKRKRRKALEDKYERYIMNKGELYEKPLGEGYISEELYSALVSLKPLDRALVHGVAVEELSYRELAIMLGKSEAVLRKRYERARKKLQNILNESENDIWVD